jgi:uncharacterized membrane protein
MKTTDSENRPSVAGGSPAVAQSKIVIPGNRGVKVVRSVIVRRPASELYAFWHNFENIPRISKYGLTVTRTSPTASHWAVSAPFESGRVEWDAVVINDEPNRLIAWRSCDGAEIPNAGSIRFEPLPGDEGVEVKVALEYDAPGGQLGALVAKVTGEEPAQQVEAALRRFKSLMETGAIPTD